MRCMAVMWKLLLAGAVVAASGPAPGDAAPTPRTAALGGLTIAGGDYQAPSHGGLESIGAARFVFTNSTDHALTVAATLELCSDLGCVPMHIAKFETDDLRSRALTIHARGRQRLVIRADLGAQHASYHVRYWHQATFTIGSDHAVVAAGSLYFRHPHPR